MKARPEPARISFTLRVNGLEFQEVRLRPRGKRHVKIPTSYLINQNKPGPLLHPFPGRHFGSRSHALEAAACSQEREPGVGHLAAAKTA